MLELSHKYSHFISDTALVTITIEVEMVDKVVISGDLTACKYRWH